MLHLQNSNSLIHIRIEINLCYHNLNQLDKQHEHIFIQYKQVHSKCSTSCPLVYLIMDQLVIFLVLLLDVSYCDYT